MTSAEFCRDIVALVTEELGAPDYEVVTLRNCDDGAGAMKMKVSQLKSDKASIDEQLRTLEREIADHEHDARERDLSNMSGAMAVLKSQFRKVAERESALKEEVRKLKEQLQERDNTIVTLSGQIQKQREEAYKSTHNRSKCTPSSNSRSASSEGSKLVKKASGLSKQNTYTKPGAARILRFGMEVAQDTGGAVVTSVDAQGYASTAGIALNDVIFDFDNKAIATPDDLHRAVKDTRSKKIHVGIIRKNKLSMHRNMLWKVIDLATPLRGQEDESAEMGNSQNTKFVRTDASSLQPRESSNNLIHSSNTPPSSPDSAPLVKSTPKRRPTIPKLHLPNHPPHSGPKHFVKKVSKMKK